jgi:ribose transport system permease protein
MEKGDPQPGNAAVIPQRKSTSVIDEIQQFIRKTSQDYAIIYVLAILVLVLSIIANNFLTVENILNVFRQASIFGILAAGEYFVIISGMIDLSIGSTLGLAGIMFALVVKKFGLEMIPLGILAALVSGLAVGWINGFTVSRMRIPPFIATLGTMLVVRGVVYLTTGAYPIVSLGSGFDYIGRGFILGIPVPVIIMGIVFLITVILSERKKTGRFFYAIGGNEEAAYLSGINVRKYKNLAFIVCGIMSAIAGIILTSRMASGQPNAGISYEFEAIIAVVLGGVSFSGGKGKALGVLFGTLFTAMLINGMTLMNINPFTQQIIKGAVFILAIWVDVLRNTQKR